MKNLKIYFTSDLHGYVYPTDYVDKSKKYRFIKYNKSI